MSFERYRIVIVAPQEPPDFEEDPAPSEKPVQEVPSWKFWRLRQAIRDRVQRLLHLNADEARRQEAAKIDLRSVRLNIVDLDISELKDELDPQLEHFIPQAVVLVFVNPGGPESEITAHEYLEKMIMSTRRRHPMMRVTGYVITKRGRDVIYLEIDTP